MSGARHSAGRKAAGREGCLSNLWAWGRGTLWLKECKSAWKMLLGSCSLDLQPVGSATAGIFCLFPEEALDPTCFVELCNIREQERALILIYYPFYTLKAVYTALI